MMRPLKERWFRVGLLGVALAVPLLVENRYFFQVLTMSCLYAVGALSLNLILGYTGQASLAHGGFFAIGAYGVAILTHALGWSFWLALPAAALLSSGVGLLVGAVALRTRGAYFAIATLCLGEIVHLVTGNWIELTGGHNGIVGIAVPGAVPLPWVGAISFESQTARYYLVLALLLLTLFVMHRLVHSATGLTFMAVRGNETLAEALGIHAFRTKLTAFVVANFIVGLAGGVYASFAGSISPSVASVKITFDFLLYVLLGGAATLAGPIVGAFAIPVVAEYLQFLQDYQMMMYGLLLVLVSIHFPRGLMGGITTIERKLRTRMGA